MTLHMYLFSRLKKPKTCFSFLVGFPLCSCKPTSRFSKVSEDFPPSQQFPGIPICWRFIGRVPFGCKITISLNLAESIVDWWNDWGSLHHDFADSNMIECSRKNHGVSPPHLGAIISFFFKGDSNHLTNIISPSFSKYPKIIDVFSLFSKSFLWFAVISMGFPWGFPTCVASCSVSCFSVSVAREVSWSRRHLGLFGRFHSHRGTPKWLVYSGKSKHPIEMDDDCGYPYFRKPLFGCDWDKVTINQFMSWKWHMEVSWL